MLQTADYYPFGLEHADPSAYQVGGVNQYKFNGSVTGDVEGKKAAGLGMEEIQDHGLNIYHAFYRTYDPVIGRMMQIDPLAEEPGLISITPYNAFLNNPSLYSDPNGDFGGGSRWQQFKNNVAGEFKDRVSSITLNDVKTLAKDVVNEVGNVINQVASDARNFVGAVKDGDVSTAAEIGYNYSGAGVIGMQSVDPSSQGMQLPSNSKEWATTLVQAGGMGLLRGKGKGPKANAGQAKPHGAANHNSRIDNWVDKLGRDPDVTNIRKNQQQVDIDGNKVGTNRPDVQFDKNATHHNLEWDNSKAASQKHQKQVNANDPNAKNKFWLLRKDK